MHDIIISHLYIEALNLVVHLKVFSYLANTVSPLYSLAGTHETFVAKAFPFHNIDGNYLNYAGTNNL